jgi:uncharacterized protein YndB with AHSA1/START domain
MTDFEQSRELAATPDAVWRLISDPHRVAEWVPTAVSSQPTGDETVRLRGESHGHDYDTLGGFVADAAALSLTWNSARREGYSGVLTVAAHGTGARVTVRVTIPDVPPSADTEMARGLTETLDRIDQLTES